MLERVEHRLRATRQEDYTSEAVFAAEQAAIFDEEWVMVGRAGNVPEPGDYMTARLGTRPIAVVRQRDGSLKAFANFCLHRYARLLDGTGHSKRIVCPYHAWTYDLTGQLIGVPDREGFCNVSTRELYLEELACETVLGFVFVSRRKGIDRISERLAPLAGLVERYGLDEWEDRHTVHEESWNGNWKFVIENFIESYHTTYAHKGSIGPTNPTHLAEQGPTGYDYFNIHSNSYRPEDLPEVHNPRLLDEDRNKFHVVGLYPNGLAAFDPNFLWWMALEPMAPGKTNARWGLSFAPEAMAGMADPEDFVTAIRRTIEIATVEDKEMVERAQDGAAFDSAEPGYLHDWLEVYVHEFQAYVARTLEAHANR
jgi:phenylpropionate dioxygenase-like ring-hydroxylating dioxygenase large terminal subunit